MRVSLSGAGSQLVGQWVPALGERSWTSPRHLRAPLRRAPRPAPRSHGGSTANLPGGAATASPPETFFFLLFFFKGVLFSFSSLSFSLSFFIAIIVFYLFLGGEYKEWGGENCIFQIRLRKGWGWGLYLGLRILSSASDNLEVFGESRGERERERSRQAGLHWIDFFLPGWVFTC